MAATTTIRIDLADLPQWKALLEAVAGLTDVLDDMPEGSGLDDEWVQWVGDMVELRDHATAALARLRP